MRSYIVTIDEKKINGDPALALLNLKGVKDVFLTTNVKKATKPLSDDEWINPNGRPATDEEIELLAQQMEAETDFIPIEEARKLGHQLIDKWSKELK
jgi:hypothetical protein